MLHGGCQGLQYLGELRKILPSVACSHTSGNLLNTYLHLCAICLLDGCLSGRAQHALTATCHQLNAIKAATRSVFYDLRNVLDRLTSTLGQLIPHTGVAAG